MLFVCYVKRVGSGRNGWPSALQGGKGEEKDMRLDQDKRGDLKAKESKSVVCAWYPW